MKVEVQFRTIAMDFWASLEHKLRYKKNIPEELARQLSVELKECSEISNELDNRMQAIRDRIGWEKPVHDERDRAKSLKDNIMLVQHDDKTIRSITVRQD